MVVDDAQAVLDTGAVCDACLGRCFADRGHGLTNEERGRALRVCVAMERDEPFEPVEPAACWVCRGLTQDYGDWADRADRALEDLEFETVLVGTHAPSFLEENETALREQAGLEPDAGEPFKAECNRAVGKRLEQLTGATVDYDFPDVVAILHVERDAVDLQLNPAYLAGRYRKLERGLAQRMRVCRVCNARGTQWREGEAQPCENCGGSGYDTKESVEWYITGPIRDGMEGTDTVFNCTGREDDDVLVLGPGRPFAVEVKEPRRRPPDPEALRTRINDASGRAIEVVELVRTGRDVVQPITQTPIRQTYRVTMTFASPVAADDFAEAMEALDGAIVRQPVERGERTVDRIRTLDGITGELTAETDAVIELESTDGIDLEALVTGEDGGSEPNLADLLRTAVTETTVAVVSVEGEGGPLDVSDYRRS